MASKGSKKSLEKSAAKTGIITITTAESGELIICIAGSGEINIDWGDGSKIETHKVSEFDVNEWYHYKYYKPNVAMKYRYHREFSEKSTITIIGEKVTHLGLYYSDYLCDFCNVTSLDISKNSTLIELFYKGCDLTSIDLSKNSELQTLMCFQGQLTSLDVSKNTKLETLCCGNNDLTSLNLSNNTNLKELTCFYNELTSLNVSKNVNLKYLDCSFNDLTGSALDALFEMLNSFEERKFISISNNPGAKDCNKSIAETKGWKVKIV